MSKFIFTPENLIDNLDKLGAWSSFSLAETDIFHYHPHVKRIKDPHKQLQEIVKLSGPFLWADWIRKYHKEVGYKGPFNPEVVNEY